MAVVVTYWNTVQIDIDTGEENGVYPKDLDNAEKGPPIYLETQDQRFVRVFDSCLGYKGERFPEMTEALKSRPSANHDLGEITIVDGYKKSEVLERLRGLTLIGLLEHLKRKWFDPPYYSKHGGYS